MHKTLSLIALIWAGTIFVSAQASDPDKQRAVSAVVQTFENGLQKRDLKQIEKAVAPDLVVFENGRRNDGWKDFRDNHLVPEMKEPAPPMKTELIKIKVTPEMAWAYSRSEFAITSKGGSPATAELWSIYVLERRKDEWKIVLLDWSIRSIPSKR